MGFLNKLIQIYLTGISPKVQVFTISNTKGSFQKERAGRKKRKKAVSKQSQRWWRALYRANVGRQCRKGEGGTETRGEEAKTLHAPFPGLFLLPEPSSLLYLDRCSERLQDSLVTSFQSHGFLEGKVQARSILNSPRESSASMQADQRENKILPPPREEQLDISPIPSPAYDLEVHLDLPQTAHSARGGSLQGGPFPQMLASEP